MRAAAHQTDAHTMLIDGRDVSIDGAKLDTIESGAEINNLTDAQAQSLTSGTNCNWHTHDGRYYTKSELQTGLGSVAWANLTGIPQTFTPSAHNHDEAYYTKTQLDAGQLDSRYYTEAEIDELITAASAGVEGAVDTYALLPATGLTVGMIYIVRQTVGEHEEGFYRWNGSAWDFLVNNTGVETHNGLAGLNDGDYKHLTMAEYSGLTGLGSTSLHTHDDRYYTETEINSLLATKSDISHTHSNVYTKTELDGGQLNTLYYTKTQLQTAGSASVSWSNLTGVPSAFVPTAHDHNDAYYTKTQLDAGQLDSRYFTESEVDAKLSLKSDATHLHDDRYYTESETAALLAGKSDLTHNHDTIYYTKTQLQSAGSASVAWANLANVPSTFAPSAHTHDDRYYTETEITSFLATKSDTTHNHDSTYYTKTQMQTSGSAQLHWNNITNKPTFGGNTWIAPVKEKYSGSSAPSSATGYSEGDRLIWYSGTGANQHVYQLTSSVWVDVHTPVTNDTVMVSNDGDSHPAQYWFSGTSWIKIADPDYADHGSLSGLLDDDHTQYLTTTRHAAISGNPHGTTLSQAVASDASITWTVAQLNTLLDGSDVSLHIHDTRYYTKAQSDAAYATASHLHDARYYQVGSVTVATVAANDPNTDITAAELETLTNGSNADGLHTHSGGGGGTATLDSAYGAYGVGRVVTVDYGAIELQAQGGFSPLKLKKISYVPNQWLGGGEMCFYDDEIFYYDSTKGKWMSVSALNFSASSSNAATSGYLYTDQTQMTSSLGFTMPFNGVVVGMSMSNLNASASGQLYIYKAGVEVTNIWFSGLSSYSYDLNAAFSAGDVLSLYVSSSGSSRPNKPIATFIIRRTI